MGYEVTVNDGGRLVVADADTYQLEGPLTTFFRTEADRPVVDCWSVRVASSAPPTSFASAGSGSASCGPREVDRPQSPRERRRCFTSAR